MNAFTQARAFTRSPALTVSDLEAIERERARIQVEQLEAIIDRARDLLPMAGRGLALACPDGAAFVNALWDFTGCDALYDFALDVDAPFGTMGK